MKQREDPTFWAHEEKEFKSRAAPVQRDYEELCRRFRGEAADEVDATTWEGGRGSYANFTQLAARIMRGDLMFRCPRPQVAPPRYERGIFTRKLATIRTLLLQDFVQESDYYQEMRRAGLDAALSYLCVVKVQVSLDDKLQRREAKIQEKAAQDEGLLYATAGRRPRIRKGDSHKTHAVQHAMFVAAVQRGEILMLPEDLEVMQRHIEDHVDRIPYERETTQSRFGRVQVRRIHPENYSFDPWAERHGDCEWHNEAFNERIEDARAKRESGEYECSRETIEALSPVTSRRQAPTGAGRRGERGAINTDDKHFRCHEVVDMVEGKVIRYGEGGVKPLKVRDWPLAGIMLSGPYKVFSLIEDPDETFGVCPPMVGMPHQVASSKMMADMTETVERQPPMSGVNGAVLSLEAQERVKSGGIAEIIVLENLPPDFDVSKAFGNVEPAKIHEQTTFLEQLHRGLPEKMLGLGTRLSGTDEAKTATATMVLGNSVNSLAEDGGAGWDDFQSRILADVSMLQSATYSPRQAGDAVGDIAYELGGWPATGFADADVVDLRGVAVVPNSSRRNESVIRAQLLGEVVRDLQSSPLAMTPVGQATLAEAYTRRFESVGEYGMGLEGAAETLMTQQTLADAGAPQAGEEGGAGQGQEPQGEPPSARPSEATSGKPSASAQGAANVGGGRVPTGAGQGDKKRMIR